MKVEPVGTIEILFNDLFAPVYSIPIDICQDIGLDNKWYWQREHSFVQRHEDGRVKIKTTWNFTKKIVSERRGRNFQVIRTGDDLMGYGFIEPTPKKKDVKLSERRIDLHIGVKADDKAVCNLYKNKSNFYWFYYPLGKDWKEPPWELGFQETEWESICR